MVRQSAEVVNQMVSVERVSAYADLPSEAPTATAADEKYAKWPNNPSILLDAVTVRYQANLPPALRGVTIKIRGGEKIGIVGR
jgi:ABC-type multidrug transport system fused ATPase/permease subunit